MKISFSRLKKANRFNYKPRYYDAEKEADAKRKKEIERNIQNPERIDLRREMRQKWGRHDRTRTKSRTYTLAIYVVILFVIIYYLFFK